MKIVISSTGPNLSDAVDPRFGRAAYLCIYDTDEKKLVDAIDNTEGVQAAQGAGINAAGLVASKGVEIILTGRVGPKAMAVVDKAGIKVVSGVTGSVEEALAGFLNNTVPVDVKQDANANTSTTTPSPRTCAGGGGGGGGGGRCGGTGGGGGGGRGAGCRRGGQGRV